MREYTTVKKKTYVVTPKVICTVTEPDGSIIATCSPNQQTAFVAQTDTVLISDDTARVTEVFKGAFLSAPGEGTTTFQLPATATSWEAIEKHFSLHAQPGSASIPAAETAPSAVYISRVPWARLDEESAQWVNNTSTVDETVFGVLRKLMDNAGLQHECSTDTAEGVDDYNGKLWPFYWQHANYVLDDIGNKHITAIKGTSDFSTTENVCAFGPAFWFFCCLERSRKEDGTWNTHDGTQEGTPLFQLWGISARPWEELDAGRRTELTALGVTIADFHLWPECQIWDDRQQQLLPRPYWCHSAYLGGADPQADGSAVLVSKPGKPLWNYLNLAQLNGLLGPHPGMAASACIQGFGMLFDIVKNATKDSQSIHRGLCAAMGSALSATLDTASADYVFPISTQGEFRVGRTACLWQSNSTAQYTPFLPSASVQLGRIAAIETRTLTLKDGGTASSLCLVFEEDSIEPFLVRTDVTAAQELSDQGIYACCYATPTMAMSGETDSVIGLHDGSRTSFTDGYHPYRVMGTEYSVGGWVLAGDTVANKQENVISIFQAPPHIIRLSQGAMIDFTNLGYKLIGTFSASGSPLYILNEQLTAEGIALPANIGGKGSGSDFGHADILIAQDGVHSMVTGGRMGFTWKYAGSAAMSVDIIFEKEFWYCCSRI